jgi:hypothetical protein
MPSQLITLRRTPGASFRILNRNSFHQTEQIRRSPNKVANQLGSTPSSRANSATSSQISVRSTAIRRNSREYLFLFSVLLFPESVPNLVYRLKGSLQ